MPTQDRLSVVRMPNYGTGGSVSYTGTAANSANLPLAINGVWVVCSTDAWARFAPGATATVNDFPIPAFTLVWLPKPDDAETPCRLSIIRDAADGVARFCTGL